MKASSVHIGIFGKRNQGKSALINALAGQEIAIVSANAGTTTDPVKKSIEIFGIGPAILVDTAGIDDVGELGQQRISKSMEALKSVDVALVVTAEEEVGEAEEQLLAELRRFEIPFIFVYNKSDLRPIPDTLRQQFEQSGAPWLSCSAQTRDGIEELIRKIVEITPASAHRRTTLLGDIISEKAIVLLVMPQDAEAPEGRLILPQVQTIRDLLDNHAITVAIQPEQLDDTLQKITPDLVITDSQAFGYVSQHIPTSIPLTSFSILLARSKGNFEHFLHGTPFISQLQDGDTILMLESCTHVTSCGDIGRHKIPTLLQKITGKQLNFIFVASLDPLPNLKEVTFAIQCGGCMVTKKQLQNRIRQIIEAGIPVSNYGMALAYLTGIFHRTTEIFNSLKE